MVGFYLYMFLHVERAIPYLQMRRALSGSRGVFACDVKKYSLKWGKQNV